MRPRPSGVDLVDHTLGGLEPGLPLIVSGHSGTGRSVIALQLVGATLRTGESAVLLTSEPPVLVLHQASALGLEFEDPLRDGTLIVLEFVAGASDTLHVSGPEPFLDQITGDACGASLLVIDPLTAFCTELVDENVMRALIRGLFERAPELRIVLTVEEAQLGSGLGFRRVLLDSCGSYLRLERNAAGDLSLVVQKTRSSEPPGHPLPFRITRGGASLLHVEPEVPASRAETPRVEVEEVERPVLLLLEPDAAACAEFASWLGDRYQVKAATDATQALAAFIAQRPDVVIAALDYRAPDGYEVLRALGAAAKWIPVLALLTRQRGSADRIRPLVLGAADVVSKPVDRFELLFKVDTLLQLSAPPPHTLDLTELMTRGRIRARTRVLSVSEFDFRVDRVRSLGQRFGLESTLLILRAVDAARLDEFVGVVDDTLRTEDALHALSEDAVLLLLVGTAPEHTRLALRRLDGALRAAGVKTDSICGELVKLDRVRDREGWESPPKAPRSWSELLSP